MVRTKADSSSVRAAGAKAPRKIISCPTTSSAGATTSDSSKGKGNTAGNPYFPRETPAWQKEITHYFKSATMESKKKHEAPPNENSREMTTEAQEDSSTKDAAQS